MNKKYKDTRKKYYQKNRLKINEQNRVRLNPNTEKSFSFCRDFLDQLHFIPNDPIREDIYSLLFSLKLTKIQRKYLTYQYDGITQTKMADELGRYQNTICKTFNGIERNGKLYGGIFKRFIRYLSKNYQLTEQIADLPQGHILHHIYPKVLAEVPRQYSASKEDLRKENESLKKIIASLTQKCDYIINKLQERK